MKIEFSRPTKQDIRQLEILVDKGVSQNDIEHILGVTNIAFQKWLTNINVDRIIKKKPVQNPEKFTINHPDMIDQTEVAFEAGLIKFYRMKEEYRMPLGRYKYLYKRFKEADLRMTREVLIEYLKIIESSLDGSKKKIEIATPLRVINDMRSWLTIPFEPEAIKRLATVTYFTEDEDLSTFDEKHADYKIKLWEEHNTHDFFLKRPIGELLNVNDSLIASFPEYLKEIQEITRALTQGIQELSSEST